MPARAPASMAMLQTVMRPSMDRPRMPAAELDGVTRAAGGADLADDGQHQSFAVTPAPTLPST
jgi:hypothetical protein